MTLPTIVVVQRNTVRLIPTARLKQPVLAPLAGDAGALDDLAALEGVTNDRLRAQDTGLPELDRRELVYGRAGHTFVNAAFAHTRAGGNRFNDETRGAWYCGFDAHTSLAEVSHHLTLELANIGRFDNVTDYAELIADFIGPFADLRSSNRRDTTCLDPDPAIGYPAGQALAKQLRADGGNGIVYPSVRSASGTCLVAFRPDLVQNVMQGGLWRLTWKGEPTPAVTRLSA